MKKLVLMLSVACMSLTPAAAQDLTPSFGDVLQVCAVGVFVSQSRMADAIARMPENVQPLAKITCAAYSQGVKAGISYATRPLPQTKSVKV